MKFRRSNLTSGFFLVCFVFGAVFGADTAVAQDVPQEKNYRYWTTDWSFNDIDIGKLFGRLERIGLEIPVDAEGDVSLNFKVSIPLNGLRNAKAYRISGKVSSRRLRVEQLQLAEFSTDVKLLSGVLSLDNLSTRWDETAKLAGNASLQLSPLGEVDAAVTATDLTLQPLYDLIMQASGDDSSPQLTGFVNGSLAIKAPLSNIRQVDNWTIDADLRADDLSYDETLPLTLDSGPVQLREGVLVAEQVRLGSPVDASVRMLASVRADLRDQRPFELELRGDDVPVSSLAKLALQTSTPAVTGKLDIDARGSGELGSADLADASWNLEGRIASPELAAFGLQLGLIEHQFEFDANHLSLNQLAASGDQPLAEANDNRVIVKRVQATYKIQETDVELTKLDAAIFGGRVQGEATIARDPTGTHRAKLDWSEISPRIDLEWLLSASAQLSLRTSGDVDWTVPADKVDDLEAHQGSARVAIAPIQLGSETVGDGNLALQAEGGQIDLSGSGTLLGGTFEVDTIVSLAALQDGFRALLNYSDLARGGKHDSIESTFDKSIVW